ncbi:MAG TPA: RNA-binding protein [Xanthobacteraceae bacterium]|jgi:hypothetical protein
MLAAALDEETDDGPRDRAAGTERLCIVTRVVKPTAEMVRFVIDPAGAVVPDVRRKLPGRGVWVTGTREAVASAVARNAFARGFKKPVRTGPELVNETERLLEAAALDALGMANKAGQVVCGFSKVEAAVATPAAAALLHAADAGSDGVRKLSGVLRRRDLPDGAVAVIDAFGGVQLDLALGRSNVVHACVLAGPASESFLARYGSLARFRGSAPVGGAAARCE